MAGILDILGLDPATGLKKKPSSSSQSALNVGGLGAYSGPAAYANAGAPNIASGGGGGGGSAPISGQLPFKSIQDLLGDPSAFQKLLTDDPTYKQLLGNLGNQGVQDAATRDAAFRRGILQFGAVPDFNDPQFSGLAGIDGLRSAIDPTTVEAANKYTGLGWSTLGQINTAHNRQLEDLNKAFTDAKLSANNQLGARGLTNSGEAIYQRERLQGDYDTTNQRGEQDYGQAKFSAFQGLQDYLSGQQAAYLQAERQREMERQRAAEDAANRWAALLGSMFPAAGQAAAPAPEPASAPAASPRSIPAPASLPLAAFSGPAAWANAQPAPAPRPAPKRSAAPPTRFGF